MPDPVKKKSDQVKLRTQKTYRIPLECDRSQKKIRIKHHRLKQLNLLNLGLIQFSLKRTLQMLRINRWQINRQYP